VFAATATNERSKLTLSPNGERALNVTLGLTVLIAAGLAFV
jgi:hypothetical protein